MVDYGQVTVSQILWAAAGLILLGILIGLVWKYGAPLLRIHDAMLGQPPTPGLPDSGSPGVIKRVALIESDITEIRKQVTPNHGSTALLSENIDQVVGLASKAVEDVERVENRLTNHIDATQALLTWLMKWANRQTEASVKDRRLLHSRLDSAMELMSESAADRAALHRILEEQQVDIHDFVSSMQVIATKATEDSMLPALVEELPERLKSKGKGKPKASDQ